LLPSLLLTDLMQQLFGIQQDELMLILQTLL